LKFSGFFCFRGILQRFDLCQQTIAAQAPFVVDWHRDIRQFRAPAASFRLASHRGSALCALLFHLAMMAQLVSPV
jgi:hypothetical protein